MATFARALLIALVVTMAIESVDMDMSDCQSCPDDGNRSESCDDFCVSPFGAVIPVVEAKLPEAGSLLATLAARQVVGRTGHPDPHPPRPTILS